MIYIIRMGIEVAGIDHGPLRKQIVKYHLIFLLIGLIYIYSLTMILTPWLQDFVLKIALNKTNLLIDQNEI